MPVPSTPLVSVILPTCDRAEITERCLDALIGQSYPKVELIVVDDGSRDQTPAMLERFADEHTEADIKVIRNEQNRGANASRNTGVAASSGDLIAFLDSDCIAEADWIEELVAGFVDERVGAVTGLVLDPPARSIYDLTFRGTHRLSRPGPARRLVAGNLCVRRDALLESSWSEDGRTPPPLADGQPDTSFSGACDEESLAVNLKAAGWTMLACPDAVVLHEHYYDRRSFFRQSYHGGRAAADYVRRHKLPHRLDMKLFMLAWGALPIALGAMFLVGWWALAVPAFFFGLALAAITYNDLWLKQKTIVQTLVTFPVLLAYYHVRLWGYVTSMIGRRNE